MGTYLPMYVCVHTYILEVMYDVSHPRLSLLDYVTPELFSLSLSIIPWARLRSHSEYNLAAALLRITYVRRAFIFLHGWAAQRAGSALSQVFLSTNPTKIQPIAKRAGFRLNLLHSPSSTTSSTIFYSIHPPYHRLLSHSELTSK